MFNQTFEPHDLIVIGFLVLLEGVLSIDNALVLGLLARRLPKEQQKKALSYGLIGALVFRLIAIATATLLMQMRWVKLLGGAYLVFISLKHFFFEKSESDPFHPHEKRALAEDGSPILVDADTGAPFEGEALDYEVRLHTQPASILPGGSGMYKFWYTVLVIELSDIAFAVDSILAAIGLVANTAKTWVIFIGGFLGVILMRFAAAIFIGLLDRFPRFEVSAYLLVLLIGVKLAVDWWFNPDLHHPRLDFHSLSSPAAWLFWGLMVVCFCVGFIPPRKQGERR